MCSGSRARCGRVARVVSKKLGRASFYGPLLRFQVLEDMRDYTTALGQLLEELNVYYAHRQLDPM